MSAHYDLLPLADYANKPKGVAWLSRIGLLLPDGWQESRQPTLSEIRTIVAQLVDDGRLVLEQDFEVVGGDLDVTLTQGDDMTILSVDNAAQDSQEDQPSSISFQYGSGELVLTISEFISQVCGPCLLTMDGAFFIMVTPGISPDAPWVTDDF